MADTPDLRPVAHAILVPGPIAAMLVALFPAWLSLIVGVAGVVIVGLTLRLVAEPDQRAMSASVADVSRTRSSGASSTSNPRRPPET